MTTRFSRRTVMTAVGVGALSAAGLRTAAASAQATSPYVFPSGASLTWAAPWAMSDDNTATKVVANSVRLATETKGELIVGFYDAATTIDEVTKTFLTFLVQDPAVAPVVSGGEDVTTDAGGAAVAEMTYQVHSLSMDGERYGIFFQLVDKTGLSIFVAPVATFATEFASAQGSVQLDGIGVLGGVEGKDIQADLEDSSTSAGTPVASETYVIPTGNITVAWANGWTVVSQDEIGIELTDPEKGGILAIGGYATEGRTWEELSVADVAFLFDDQGADATVAGPTVTDSGYAFATDGEFGLRLAQATASEDPATYILMFAHQMTGRGTAAVDWLKDAQAAVSINGAVPLQGLETFIDTSAG